MGVKPINYKKYLTSDILAGITVSIILIPQSLAYAQLAGLPAHYGLYASFLPPILAALFGSSKHLATGPVAVLSLMTFSAVSQYHKPGTSEYITLALVLAFMLGVIQVVFSLIKLGNAVSLLSHPVIYGFTNAAAIIIAISQLPKIFGITLPATDHLYQSVFLLLGRITTDIHLPTFILGIWALITFFTLRKINKHFPSTITVVLVATIYSWLSGYSGEIVGKIPGNIPAPILPNLDFEIMLQLLPTVIIMGVVGFTEVISIAQSIAIKTRDRVDPNKELFGQGVANLIGSIFQSYPVSGSFSRTAVNFQAKGKTALSSIVCGLIVMLVILFFTRLLYFLPQVILAAVIIVSVSSLVNIKKLIIIWSSSRHDVIAALITFSVTLYFAPHLDKGLAMGVLFSLGYYLYKNLHPRVVFLSKYKDGWFHDAHKFKLKRCSNVAVVRLDGQLFFANSAYIENVIINDLVKNPDITDVLLMANGINSIDATGEHMLYSLWKTLKRNGKTLHISSLKSQITEVLKRTGLFSSIGNENFHPTLDMAIESLLSAKAESKTHIDRLHCPLQEYIATAQDQEKNANKKSVFNFRQIYKKAILRLNRY